MVMCQHKSVKGWTSSKVSIRIDRSKQKWRDTGSRNEWVHVCPL